MELRIDIAGYKNNVIITSIPKRFVHKIYKHCLGKNNTPYFANNCFKGILYFDEELAGKFAEAVGFSWSGWWNAHRLYHRAAYCFENSLKMTACIDGVPEVELYPDNVAATPSPVHLSPFLTQIAKDEVLILLGSVDKGTQTFTLPALEGDFRSALLNVSVDTFTDFGFDEPLITSITYDGKELTPVDGPSKGRRMLEPRLFSKLGHELDAADFPPVELPGL
ncbi:hypothetical protein ACI3L3_08355 [Desulfobaculum sp. SPO524]|uniref:hypothetical protein n=1 Tax=Desulfobaculum sp. SPO524 TaxID=3378071 RepID=UPI0038528FD4